MFDDDTDLIAVAHGFARFLGVESCGQCVPCKDDGLAIADVLDAIRSSSSDPEAIGEVRRRLATVADGARCSLASQHTLSVASLFELGRTVAQDHVAGRLQSAEPYVVAPIIDMIDGQAILDATFADKNPDWSHGGVDSGSVPAELYADTPVAVRMSASTS